MTTVMEYMERYHTGKVISGCDYLTGMEVSARKRLLEQVPVLPYSI